MEEKVCRYLSGFMRDVSAEEFLDWMEVPPEEKMGDLRTTIIGNALHNMFQKLGYHTVRINHLGDWGTQFGKLIVAYK